MKLTNKRLKRIIREETRKALNEESNLTLDFVKSEAQSAGIISADPRYMNLVLEEARACGTSKPGAGQGSSACHGGTPLLHAAALWKSAVDRSSIYIKTCPDKSAGGCAGEWYEWGKPTKYDKKTADRGAAPIGKKIKKAPLKPGVREYTAGNWKLQIINGVNGLAAGDDKNLMAVLKGKLAGTIIKNSGGLKTAEQIRDKLKALKGHARIKYMHQLCGGNCKS